jgi:hypothetical protein
MDKIVKYGKVANTVVLIFPDEAGANHFIHQIETQNILRKMGMDKMPVHSLDGKLNPRTVV